MQGIGKAPQEMVAEKAKKYRQETPRTGTVKKVSLFPGDNKTPRTGTDKKVSLFLGDNQSLIHWPFHSV